MKLFFSLLVVFFLGGCTIGSSYVLHGSNTDVHEISLYRDKEISIDIDFFSGHISRLYFLSLGESKNLDVEIIRIQHAVNVDGDPVEFESTQGFKPMTLDLAKNPLYVFEKRYNLTEHPEIVVEFINMLVTINGEEVDISKEFTLRKVTYSVCQAMQGI